MNELAARVNEIFYDYDPYEYRDSDMSLEKTTEMLNDDPYEAIRILCGMVEDLTEE